MVSTGGDVPRAVLLVGNAAAPYSRALRVGRALAAEGFAVEIAAVWSPGHEDAEHDGELLIRRYRPRGTWARFGRSSAAADGGVQGAGYQASSTIGASASPARPPRTLPARARAIAGALRRWLFWPHSVRGWWSALDTQLAPADLYHAFGSLAIAPALRARDRHPRGPVGRRARVVYDAIDDVFESNNVLDMPRPIRAWHRRRETRWARRADVVTTVNESLAERLMTRWALREPLLVMPNYPEPPAPVLLASPPDLIRRELGLAPEVAVLVFQGRLGPRLGLDEIAEAVLRLPDAALVVIGFGRAFAASRARDSDPRFAGRHFTLPARHPDELLAWTASADVALIPLPPVSINQRLSSPNKFWEAVAVGTPVVVPRALGLMADLVERFDLGAIAETNAPEDLAAAVDAILSRGPVVRREWRSRIAATAAREFSWPRAAEAYRERVRDLA